MNKKISLLASLMMSAASVIFSNGSRAQSSSADPNALSTTDADVCLGNITVGEETSVNNIGCRKLANECAVYFKSNEEVPTLVIWNAGNLSFWFRSESNAKVSLDTDRAGTIQSLIVENGGDKTQIFQNAPIDPEKISALTPKDRETMAQWLNYGKGRGCSFAAS